VVARDRRPALSASADSFFRRRSASVTTSLKACADNLPLRIIVGVLVVKSTIWALSLGRARRRCAGAAPDEWAERWAASKRTFSPFEGAGFWPLISMAGYLAARCARALTGVIFALELTHDVDVLLPLLLP